MARDDLAGVRAVGIGHVHLVALVVRDPPTVLRRAEAVSKLLRVPGQVVLVPAVAIHPERVRVALDQRLEPQLRGLAWPEEETGVVEADAVDRREVRRRPGRQR